MFGPHLLNMTTPALKIVSHFFSISPSLLNPTFLMNPSPFTISLPLLSEPISYMSSSICSKVNYRPLRGIDLETDSSTERPMEFP